MGLIFNTCGPNECMVVSGCLTVGGPNYVVGGRAIVLPFIQQLQTLSLNVMTLRINSPVVYSIHGVPLTVVGTAQVKISGNNKDMLVAACEMFLGKNEDEIKMIAQETLEGHQRAIIGTMSVEEIYKDRKKFNHLMLEMASKDLITMGIAVMSYTINEVKDDQGYLLCLGMSRNSEVKRDARIGEASNKMAANIATSIAEEKRKEAVFYNETEKARAHRDFGIKKHAYDSEVNTQKAEADMAYELQAAKTRQKIKEEEMTIMVVERLQRINLQEQEIERRRKELEATIYRPAEAEKYRVEKLAEAARNKMIYEAEATAESTRLKGEAEAFAIEAKAKAEAIKMSQKAEAFEQYGQAAMIEMYLKMLPEVAAEVSGCLSETKKVTMISSGNSPLGAQKLTAEVADIISSIPGVVKGTTGIDIIKMMAMQKK